MIPKSLWYAVAAVAIVSFTTIASSAHAGSCTNDTEHKTKAEGVDVIIKAKASSGDWTFLYKNEKNEMVSITSDYTLLTKRNIGQFKDGVDVSFTASNGGQTKSLSYIMKIKHWLCSESEFNIYCVDPKKLEAANSDTDVSKVGDLSSNKLVKCGQDLKNNHNLEYKFELPDASKVAN